MKNWQFKYKTTNFRKILPKILFSEFILYFHPTLESSFFLVKLMRLKVQISAGPYPVYNAKVLIFCQK